MINFIIKYVFIFNNYVYLYYTPVNSGFIYATLQKNPCILYKFYYFLKYYNILFNILIIWNYYINI